MDQEERRTKMAYKLKVKNKIYDLKDGFTIKEELNETLDSATGIEFETFHEEFIGVPFDHATIYDTENKIEEKHLLIDTYDDEVYSFEENAEENNHHYFVKLFSETKGLERITLPNLTVTQPTAGTKTTIYSTMQKLRECYIPMLKIYTTLEDRPNHYLYSRKYDYSLATIQKFQNSICPEFQWNNPTLREVLTDLFSVEDCIPVVRKGMISYYSFKEKGNPIDTSKLSYSKRTMSSGDFVGELTLNMKNGIGKSSTTCCEYIMLHPPVDSATLTTENGVIRTMNPIYNIKKLVIYSFGKYNSNGEDKCRAYVDDFASRVKEYEDWNLLSNVKVGSSKYRDLPNGTDARYFTTKEHKVNYLYYERGKNEIHNIAKVYSSSGIFGETFVKTVLMNYHPETVNYEYPYGGERSLFFYIEYETILDNPINVGKYLPSPHPENRVFDSQKDSYVDVRHQSIFEYAKVERLGNKIREIYGEYFNESAIPQLGDYIGDEILFSREVTYYDNILLFKGYLTPHYILKDFYTGVMAKKRSWEIAKGDEALTRHDVYKLYVEASTKVKKDDFEDRTVDPFRIFKRMTPNTDSNNTNAVKPFLSSLLNYDANKNIVHAFVWTRGDGEDFPVDNFNDGIICDLASEVQGNSICFNFGFNDNFKSADYIEMDDTELIQSTYKYCSKVTGRMQWARIYLIGKTYGIGDGVNKAPIAGLTYPPATVDWFFIINRERPKFNQSDAEYQNDGFMLVTLVNKDNREIIKWNIQIEYCSDNKDIIIGKKFIENCKIVNSLANDVTNLKLAFSKKPYSLGENKIHSDSVSYDFDQYNLELQVNEENDYSCAVLWTTMEGNILGTWEQYPYWAICDADGNILIAVNSKDNSTIYFNLLRSRDTKVYMNRWSQEVAGDISDVDHITPVE